MAGELTLRYVRRVGKRSESQFMRGERFAQAQGTSVNAVLRDYLSRFARTQSAQANAAKRVLELSKTARSGRGKAWRTRDDFHER
jgi:hypothetical protein